MREQINESVRKPNFYDRQKENPVSKRRMKSSRDLYERRKVSKNGNPNSKAERKKINLAEYIGSNPNPKVERKKK